MKRKISEVVVYAISLKVDNQKLWLYNNYGYIIFNSDFQCRDIFKNKDVVDDVLNQIKNHCTDNDIIGYDRDLTEDDLKKAKIVKITRRRIYSE